MPTNHLATVDNKNNNALLCQPAVCMGECVCVFVSMLLICFAWLVKLKAFVIEREGGGGCCSGVFKCFRMKSSEDKSGITDAFPPSLSFFLFIYPPLPKSFR